MMKKTDFDKSVVRLCDEWNHAEKAIKLAEQVNGEIINPAIYELRYGGRRVVEALVQKASDPDKALKLIDDAIFDCCRARHDAIDAATSKIAADLKIAVEKLGAHTILANFSGFSEFFGELSTAREKIANSREDRENRDGIYASIQETDLPKLVKRYSEFQASEPLMIEAARKQKRERDIGYAIGVTGVVLAAIFGILSLF